MKKLGLSLFLIGLLGACAFGQADNAHRRGHARVQESALKTYQAPPVPAASAWPKEKLQAFAQELTDFIIKNHTVTDPARMCYGMTYEFWRDGMPMQLFSLDEMHDGAWFTGAVATAHRAFPQGGFLEPIQKYQIPFYVNMMCNSDKLFPAMKKGGEDNKPLAAPVKGYVPRGWDDGEGYDKDTAKKFKEAFSHEPPKNRETTVVRDENGKFIHAYYTPSNHLAQDLADGLFTAWLSTRDPEIAQAVQYLQDYRAEYCCNIGPVALPASIMSNNQALYDRNKGSDKFAPEKMGAYYTGLFQMKGNNNLMVYDDGLAWGYHDAVGVAFKDGKFPDDFVQFAAARVYALDAAIEFYWDTIPFRHGMYFFDLQGGVGSKDGKLKDYISKSRNLLGARGAQIAWVGAGILPALKQNPQLWEKYYQEKFASEPLVRIVDTPPATDGKKDDIYGKSKTISAGSVKVTLLGDPKNLHLFIEGGPAQLTIKHAGVANAPYGTIAIAADGKATAQNNNGEEILLAQAGKPGAVEIRIPYSVVPAQACWMNGVDHGRYEITINDAPAQVVYMLSEPARIIARLERIALGTIANWSEYFHKEGVLPSGARGPGNGDMQQHNRWKVSDSGSYAVVIETCALYSIYRDGQTEWDVIKAQAPKQPLKHQPLPDTVLAAQGLK